MISLDEKGDGQMKDLSKECLQHKKKPEYRQTIRLFLRQTLFLKVVVWYDVSVQLNWK